MNKYGSYKEYFSALPDRYKNSKRRYKIGIPLLFLLLLFYIFCLPRTLFDVPYSTVVFDRNGELLGARLATDEQWRFPTIDSVPEKYKICLIEFEDRHYNYHWGVNPLAMLRAVKQNFSEKRIVSGGSTITMQTIRLARKEKRTYGEKLIETILATRLEFKYSKDEILNLYASHAPMGANVVGIAAASWRYFGHDVSTLSWAEAATLAVLPNSPAMMHFGRNRNKLIGKRNRLLQHLRDKNYLTETDFQLAISEPLPAQPYALPQTAPHLVTRAYIEHKGQQITSTIDKQHQLRTEAILSRWNAEFAQNEIKNIAAVIIDVQQNEIIAYCGNVHFERRSSANQVDILQAPRSTGSILKPFLYCAMLNEGLLMPNELTPDVPVNINGFAPKNFSLKYDGAAPASEALARSLNIPFVVMLRKYGIQKLHNLLRRAGMTTITRSADNYGLSLILGGAEGKLLEISNIYSVMAQTLNHYNAENKYKDIKPAKYILSATETPEITNKPIFSAGAIWQTFNALTNVNRPEEIDWRSIPSMQKIAWKTGTSFGFRDGWSVGVTPRYVVGVWVGNSDGEGRPGLVGARTAGLVMFDIFNSLPASRWFSTPLNDLVKVETCKESGHIMGINCPKSSTDTTLVCRKGLDGTPCPYHSKVHLSEDLRYRVYENCAGARGIIDTSWFVLPASWELYYREQHQSYISLPPYSPECTGNDNSKAMEFLYPYPNSVVSLPKQLDGSVGELVFEVAHRIPHSRIFWHLDKTYIGQTKGFHKKTAAPPPGEHRITAVDDDGNSASIKFVVK
ncbi:penicillin-binding protein 1C [Dysgonomonas sp. 216]|uniref:penicillin-binding protein 1C n=1 Tax=Dysgonomonas sp. 216 TaxID=2302934 RepID=UPI0013D0BD1A|nr:penicillin-binding protein 1C [Dysgonomonas sp. 216]NDW18414.1 penicillin-binding protein 1C [Dysgonomonas sp. 216]